MKSYEITYLTIPSLTTEEATSLHEEIKNSITKVGGSLKTDQTPTRKTLAYLVKNNSEGYLSSIDFDLDHEKIDNLVKKVERNENILRHLLLTKQIRKRDEEEPRRKRPSLKPEKAKLKELDDKIDEML